MTVDASALRPFLDDLWRWKCNLPPADRATIDDLYRTEWSSEFERLMRNRLVMGALRYGRLRAPDKPKYNRVGSIEKRVRQYAETGNLELLVDAANLCLIEYIEGEHPKRHFRAADDEEHVEVVR